MAKKDYPLDLIAEMDRPIAEKHLKKAAHAANQRLREIEKQGLQEESAYSIVRRAQQARGITRDKARFPEGFSTMSDREFRQTVRAIEKFMEAETSTLSGIKTVSRKVVKAVREKLNNRGRNIGDKATDKDLIKFLSSQEFRRLRQMYPSDELIEDFIVEVNNGRNSQQIIDEYREFLIEQNNSLRELYEYRERI